MRTIKNILCFILFITILFAFSTSYAVLDQTRNFVAQNIANGPGVTTVADRMVGVFNALGYNNVSNNWNGGYEVISDIATMNNYIHMSGKNYGLSFLGHGYGGFQISVNETALSPSDISGNWHLVILNACSTGMTTDFANAFHIYGYSNRGFIGWYTTVSYGGLYEWSGYFLNNIGTESLQQAHLHAANSSINPTPVRFYGDSSWYGWAWNT